MTPAAPPAGLLSMLDGMSARLRHVRDVDGAIRHVLRAAIEHFGADQGAVAVHEPGRSAAEILYELPRRGGAWDLSLLAAFIGQEDPEIPPDRLLAPIRRRGRGWGVMAMARTEGCFERGQGRQLARLTSVLSEVIEASDRERILEVRDRIDRKIMEQLRPQDLFYQILDGLRSLTRYDHSSAILMLEEDSPYLTLVAEQIAWKKGKSHRIGARLALAPDVARVVGAGDILGFARPRGGAGDPGSSTWREWEGRPLSVLADLLDYNRNPEEEREGAMLVAPLAARDGIFGVLKIAARHPEALTAYDAQLVDRFRTQAAIAIRNARHTESLETRMLEAERKHAMADLARGVSHDVNNALGAILPLVQQMQRDIQEEKLDAKVFRDDLEEIRQGLDVCRRIFGGMLAFARGAGHRSAESEVARALEGALVILRDGLDRRGIELTLEVPSGLPPTAGAQSDLEQVFLNLITNARDAMPRGGHLTVRARADEGFLVVSIEDTGAGIPPQELSRVLEAFYTTKPHGYGLGLSICRSLLWEMGGKMELASEVGRGTTVTLRLPLAAAAREGS